MLIEELVTQLENGHFDTSPVVYTQDEVFLDKIHSFESKYRRKWFEFVSAYDDQVLETCSDEQRLDFVEWRMLCDKFEQKLEDDIQGLTIMADSPPSGEHVGTKGPSDRVFCFVKLRMNDGASTHPRAENQAPRARILLFPAL